MEWLQQKVFDRLSLISRLSIVVTLIIVLVALSGAYQSSQRVVHRTQFKLINEYQQLMETFEAIVLVSSSKNDQNYHSFNVEELANLIEKFGKNTNVSKMSFRYVSQSADYGQEFKINLEAPDFFAQWCGAEDIHFNKPLIIDGEYYGLLILSMSPNRFINEAWTQYINLLKVLLFSLVIILLGLWIILGQTLKPLFSLVTASKTITAGDLSVRLPVTGSPELQTVILTFNKMASSMQSTLTELKKSESRFRQLADSLPQLVWTCDPDGSCDYLNRQWTDFTGIAESEQLNVDWLKQVHPDDRSRAKLAWETAVTEAQPSRVEYRLRRYDGVYQWFDVQGVPLFDTQGNVIKWFGSSTNITDRKNAELLLRQKEQQLSLVLEGSQLGFWDWDIRTNTVQRNHIWAQILGYSYNDLHLTMLQWKALIHPNDRDKVWRSIQANLEGRSKLHELTYRVRTKQGDYKWILDRAKVVQYDNNNIAIRMAGTQTDFTTQKLAEAELKVAATAFESQEGMMVTDANNKILRVNSAFSAITGYSKDEVQGKNPSFISSKKHTEEFYIAMWESISHKGSWDGEIWNRRKNGEDYPCQMSITAVKDALGNVINYVGTFIDISQSKAAADEIQNLAFYDPLTQLPNRRLLVDRLKQALASNARSGQRGALLFIDLDHFKLLNDTLGHDIGDLLLQQVSQRLITCVREDDTVARIGGDEFVVLLEGLNSQELEAAAQTEAVGNKILNVLTQDYHLGLHTYFNSPSIGATLFDGSGNNVNDLLKHADIAMYDAKKEGRNTLRFFDPVMQQAISQRAALEQDLRKAIEQKELQLYYQKQVNEKGSIIGAEALIRWNHPTRGLVSPFDFISLAEETGLILSIGDYVLDAACTQLKEWKNSPHTDKLTLSVNVSAKQFHHKKFFNKVKQTVERYCVDPRLLNLELTESMLLEDIDGIISKMKSLRKLGIKFELDDFGTGYSSLQYLKKLPLYRLKIDSSFVQDITVDSSDRSIVRTIITMANNLQLKVIAEGVETAEQRSILHDCGCQSYQGYLYGLPLPAEEFEVSLTTPNALKSDPNTQENQSTS